MLDIHVCLTWILCYLAIDPLSLFMHDCYKHFISWWKQKPIRPLPIVHKVHQKKMTGYRDGTCFDDIAGNIEAFPLPKLSSNKLHIAYAFSLNTPHLPSAVTTERQSHFEQYRTRVQSPWPELQCQEHGEPIGDSYTMPADEYLYMTSRIDSFIVLWE